MRFLFYYAFLIKHRKVYYYRYSYHKYQNYYYYILSYT